MSVEPPPRRCAVVIAGGRSKRMGRAKAWLDVDGRTLLLCVLDVLHACGLDVVVVGAHDEPLPSLPSTVVRLDDPEHLVGQGPLVGLATGLEWLASRRYDVAYLSGCDAALLEATHVNWMFERLQASADLDAVIPISRTARGHRFDVLGSAVVVRAASAAAQRLLRAGERSLQALASILRHDEVEADDLPCPNVLAPCNTPEQWALVRARVATQAPTPSRSRRTPE